MNVEKEESCTQFRKELRQTLGGREAENWKSPAEVLTETAMKVFGVSAEEREWIYWIKDDEDGAVRQEKERKTSEKIHGLTAVQVKQSQEPKNSINYI